MKHLTLGIHYPKKGYSQKIIKIAEKVCDVARTCDGLVEAGAWYDKENDRIIMLSLWENTDFAIQASKKLRPIIVKAPFSDWERKPSDNMIKLEKLV